MISCDSQILRSKLRIISVDQVYSIVSRQLLGGKKRELNTHTIKSHIYHVYTVADLGESKDPCQERTQDSPWREGGAILQNCMISRKFVVLLQQSRWPCPDVSFVKFHEL